MFISGTNSYCEHIGCRQDLLQWMKSGNSRKNKFTFGSNCMISLQSPKLFFRGSDLKFRWGKGRKAIDYFQYVWKLKLTYSDKTVYVPGLLLQLYEAALRVSDGSCSDHVCGHKWTLKQAGFFLEQILGKCIFFMDQILHYTMERSRIRLSMNNCTKQKHAYTGRNICCALLLFI